MAGRLAGNLEAPRLGYAIFRRAYRENRDDADACAFHAHGILERRGPLACLQFLESAGPFPSAAPAGRSHILSAQAHAATLLRDFESAEDLLRQAFDVEAEHPWLFVEQAFLRERQDRYEEALESARRALSLRSWYRPAVWSMAHALQLLNRDDEALAFLQEAATHVESPFILVQISGIQSHRRDFPEVLKCLDMYESLGVLMEKTQREWLKRRRITVACELGDKAGASALSAGIDEPYYKGLTERLGRDGVVWKKVLLDVPFVRQHHVTCVPATLAAIGCFWRKPVAHLELAEQICYDGTPAHSERHWAEEHGWRVREFTVTWDSAVALIDRGVPCAVTTAEATSGHMQAVVGYDELRRTFVVRDPYQYDLSEAIVEPFLDRYKSSGPRGLALVPSDRESLLDGIEFPDAAQYDELHRINRALYTHDRASAGSLLAAMVSRWPGHRLTLTARRAVASYDVNMPALLTVMKELCAMFPDDAGLELARAGCARDIESRETRLDLLRKAGERKDCDPVLWLEYARELRLDARQLPEAEQWVRRAMRARSMDADTIKAVADVLWDKREYAEATRHYRAAACLEDRKEHFSRSYFTATRYLKQTERSFGFLRNRFERLGGQSAEPAITLVDAYFMVDAAHQAFATLDEALKRRPDDGALIMYAADAHGRHGRSSEADALLKQASGRAARHVWLRTAADIAAYKGEHGASLEHWKAIVKTEELSLDAHRAIAHLLAATTGRAAALDYLRDVCERFPNHCELQHLRIDWLRDEGTGAMEPVLRAVILSNQSDAWVRRELAMALSQGGRHAEAEAEADLAVQMEPNNPSSYTVRGRVRLVAGRRDDARTDYLHAMHLDVDAVYAMSELLSLCRTLEEKKKALEQMHAELVRQVIFGEAVLTFRSLALGILPPPDLLAVLEEARKERPDLWQAWSMVVAQQLSMKTPDAALKTALEAAECFPMLPRTWLDLADVRHAMLDVQGELQATEKAYELNPTWDFAARRLAETYEKRGDAVRARKILERACAYSPLDGINAGCLADLMWKAGEKTAAIEKLKHAIRLNPDYEWGWNTLRLWGAQENQPRLAEEMARDLTLRRAGETRSWLLLAKALTDRPEAAGERLEAFDKAVSLDPHCVDAWDQKAELLAVMGRYEDALKCCAPPGLPDVPAELQVRSVWIEGQRGKVEDAIPRLKAVMREHPEFHSGWGLLADWCWKTEKYAEAVEAGENMAQFAPSSPVPLGYLGDMKQRSGDVEGAKEAFARALKLDPDYTFAGFSLFSIFLNAADYKAADAVLDQLKGRAHDYEVQSRRVAVLARQKKKEETWAALKALCAMKVEEAGDMSSAIDEAATAFGLWRTERVVRRIVLEEKVANDFVAEMWIELRVRRRRWSFPRGLSRLRDRGEIWRRAAIRHLTILGQNYTPVPGRPMDAGTQCSLRMAVSKFLRKNRDKVAADTFLWGQVGYALLCQGRHRRTVKECSDWEKRSDAKPWMLDNYVQCLHYTGRTDEARKVIDHVLGKFDARDDIARFQLWKAVYSLAGGDVGGARRAMKDLPVGRLDNYDKTIHDFADVACQALETESGGYRYPAEHDQKFVAFVMQHRGIRGMRSSAVAVAREISARTGVKVVHRKMFWRVYRVWIIAVAFVAGWIAMVIVALVLSK